MRQGCRPAASPSPLALARRSRQAARGGVDVNKAGGRPDAIQVGLTFAVDYLHELPRVEDLGYDSVWTSEHILFYGPTVDATVTLGAFAAVTRRVAIGTAILLLPLRHPTITAKAIATA